MKRFVALIVGIVFVAVGVYMYINHKNLVKNCTVETTATVIDMEERYSADDNGGNYMYYPIIEYNVERNTIKSTMTEGAAGPIYSYGEKITILYNPNKVEEYLVKGDKMSNVLSYIFIIVGGLVTIFGIKEVIKPN